MHSQKRIIELLECKPLIIFIIKSLVTSNRSVRND